VSDTASDTRPLRIGIIGAGSIARSAHLPAYQRLDGAEVVALADVSAEQAERLAEQFGVPDTYTDWRQLLDRRDIDAVDICTPNQIRKEPTIAACEAGKHVLVQKPMAPTLEDATAMIEAARRNKVTMGVIFMGRFSAGNALVKRLVDAGLIGRVTALRTNTGHSGGLRLPETSWRRSFDNLAGSWALLGVHSVDRLRSLGGPMTRVAAIGKTLVSDMTGDDNFSLAGEFASGAVASMQSCYNMIPTNSLFEAYGDRGTILSSRALGGIRCQATGAGEFPWAEHLDGLTPEQDEDGWWTFSSASVRDAGRLLPFPDYHSHWVHCLRHGTAPVTEGEEGRASLEIILAGYESAATERFVHLKWQTW
jgi:UDP-N-acetylglucosamine 3-dehydrogenase